MGVSGSESRLAILEPLTTNSRGSGRCPIIGVQAKILAGRKKHNRLLAFLLLCPLVFCVQGCKDEFVLSHNDNPSSGGNSPDPDSRTKIISQDCVLTSGGGQTSANDRFENDCITGEAIVITLSVGSEGSKNSVVRSGFYPPSLIPIALSVLCPSVSLFPFASDQRDSIGRFALEDRKLLPKQLLAKDIP